LDIKKVDANAVSIGEAPHPNTARIALEIDLTVDEIYPVTLRSLFA
jgi:hypothetical protein